MKRLKLGYVVLAVSCVGTVYAQDQGAANNKNISEVTSTTTVSPVEVDASSTKFEKDVYDVFQQLERPSKQITPKNKYSDWLKKDNVARAEFGKKADVLVEKFRKDGEEDQVYRWEGLEYLNSRDYDAAIKAFDKSMPLLKEPDQKAEAYADMGLAYARKKDIENAGLFYAKAKDLLSSVKDPKKYTAAFDAMATLAMELGNTAEARRMIEAWVAAKRTEVPNYLVSSPVCESFDAAGKSIDGCINDKDIGCYMQHIDGGYYDSDCVKHDQNVQFLDSINYCKSCKKKTTK